MKLQKIIAAAVLVLASSAMMADGHKAKMAEYQADCKRYAQDDGIEADMLKDYIAQCVQDLKDAETEDTGAEPQEPEEQSEQN